MLSQKPTKKILNERGEREREREREGIRVNNEFETVDYRDL